MKTLILYFILLFALPTSMLAQYTGANGRGDISTLIGSTILNQDIILVSGSNAADGYYHSLSNASGAFSAINASSQTDRTISVTIWGNSNSETGANSLNSGTWTSLTIYPKITGLSVSGNVLLPTIIALNGAVNVTIDGRFNASGSLKDLTFPKTKLFNSSTNNFIKYCSINGDLYLTETSSAMMDGVVIINGNVTIENGSTISTSLTSNVTVSGNLLILP